MRALGVDRTRPRCRFHTDPSGTFVKYEAKAIGSGSEGAQTALQEAFRKDLTLAEAEVLALSTLKQVMEDKVPAVCCFMYSARVCVAVCTTRNDILQRPSLSPSHYVCVMLHSFPYCVVVLFVMFPYVVLMGFIKPIIEALQPRVVQVTATNVDIAKVAPAYHLYTEAEVESVISRM